MTSKPKINNHLYDELGERWYTAKDDPIALLRAENRLRNPWVESVLSSKLGQLTARILDIGCGAGFLANHLAKAGFTVTGLDQSEDSLKVARQYDSTQTVSYQIGSADQLPFASNSFDVVCAMDFLEHIPNPGIVILEAARVLREGGLFFFHTFNRTPYSWLLAIKGVEWFVNNTPAHVHIYPFFIKPSELTQMCTNAGFEIEQMLGMRPQLSMAFFKLLMSGNVSDHFTFEFTRSLSTGYLGYAEKKL